MENPRGLVTCEQWPWECNRVSGEIRSEASNTMPESPLIHVQVISSSGPYVRATLGNEVVHVFFSARLPFWIWRMQRAKRQAIERVLAIANAQHPKKDP